jgi:hypothetical protein
MLSAAQHVSQALQSTSKAGQTTAKYFQRVLGKTTAYLCSCCGVTCSCAPARHSSHAYPGLRYDTGRRHHQVSTRAWRSASGPSRVVPPRPPPGALHRCTPGACQISVGISPRHPAVDNSCHLGTQHL